MRTCENCGNRMPLFVPRKRQANGQLWCEACCMGRPGRPRAQASLEVEGMAVTAPSISAFLRKEGFTPVSPQDPNREGLKVKNAGVRGGVYVTADLDSEDAAERMSLDAESVLAAAGYSIERISPQGFYLGGSKTAMANAAKDRLAEYGVGQEYLDRLPDEVAEALHTKLVSEELPPSSFNADVGTEEMYRRRAMQLVTNWLIDNPSQHRQAKQVAIQRVATHSHDHSMYPTLYVLGHDSGDGATIFHCPFCGSGQVIGGSDGTVECEFCHTRFTVQVQPNMPSMPQTVDGQPFPIPGMPGNEADPDAPPSQQPPVTEEGQPASPADAPNAPPGAQNPPAEADDDGDVPPFLRKKQSVRYYLTADGVPLDEDSYIRHLAIRHATDREGVVAQVRASRAS